MAESLIARFAVVGWDERELPDLPDAEIGWVAAATLRKEFTAGIVGSSVAVFASSGPIEGDRAYVAVERITGTLDGSGVGSFTVHHGGVESAPQSWFGHIVPHSGSGVFAGWAGSARIEHDAEGAFFVIDATATAPGVTPPADHSVTDQG